MYVYRSFISLFLIVAFFIICWCHIWFYTPHICRECVLLYEYSLIVPEKHTLMLRVTRDEAFSNSPKIGFQITSDTQAYVKFFQHDLLQMWRKLKFCLSTCQLSHWHPGESSSPDMTETAESQCEKEKHKNQKTTDEWSMGRWFRFDCSFFSHKPVAFT